MNLLLHVAAVVIFVLILLSVVTLTAPHVLIAVTLWCAAGLPWGPVAFNGWPTRRVSP